mmetsp:Transcript_93877/g.297986  ORF Transcript_93877/g.297986 Transcript_93877/m.297986 type:complete len:207 (+) Transcript_93877:95-715(+)
MRARASAVQPRGPSQELPKPQRGGAPSSLYMSSRYSRAVCACPSSRAFAAGSAPSASRNSQTAKDFRERAATIRGVSPLSDLGSTIAPALRSSWQTSMCAPAAAMCSAVQQREPSSFEFTSAPADSASRQAATSPALAAAKSRSDGVRSPGGAAQGSTSTATLTSGPARSWRARTRLRRAAPQHLGALAIAMVLGATDVAAIRALS